MIINYTEFWVEFNKSDINFHSKLEKDLFPFNSKVLCDILKRRYIPVVELDELTNILFLEIEILDPFVYPSGNL